MLEVSTLSGKSKIPMLPSQGASYAKWGRWVDAFSSCIVTFKGLNLFAALDSSMPVEFPEDEDEDEDEESKDAKPKTELLNVLTLQCKVANKYEFAAKSALRRMRFCTRPRRTHANTKWRCTKSDDSRCTSTVTPLLAEPLCYAVSYRYVSDHLYLGRLLAGRGGVRSWRWVISRHGERSLALARRAPCRRSRTARSNR